MGCVRLDSFSIEDFARLAGRPHEYPTVAATCPGCGATIAPTAVYCTVECGEGYRKRIQHGFGRAALSVRQEGMETSIGHSYAPGWVRR